MTGRRFTPPWKPVRTPGGYMVTDAAGVPVCYIYGEDRPKGVADRSLSVDEARRIAAGIARLPELLGRGKTTP